MLIPPYTGNDELDSFLVDLSINAGTGSGGTAGIYFDNEPLSGEPVGYQNQFIHIKYADDNQGTNLTNAYAFKTFFGIYNSNSSVESANPADYTWYEVSNSFGSLRKLYYLILGGRNIKFAVSESQPNYRWQLDAGLAIDLDIIVPSKTITANELLDETIVELNISAGAVTATKTNIAALDQATGDLKANTVSAAQILNDAVTELKILDGAITSDKIYAAAVTADKVAANSIGANQIAANAVTAVKIEAGAITTAKINAGAVTSDKISVNNLNALSANTGDLTVTGNVTMGLPADPNFKLDSSTNQMIYKSALTGARQEIVEDYIKFFNDAGSLVVQIGNLSK